VGWRWRDPDLGRDRTTRALGRRDWNWFTPYAGGTGAAAADVEPAQPPWAAHPVTPHDKNDRTLGIPLRHISMWPDLPVGLDHNSAHRDRLAAVLDDLRHAATPRPPPAVDPDMLAAALAELAPQVHRRALAAHSHPIITTAHRHRLEPAVLHELACGVGQMVAQTTHRAGRAELGEPALNALLGADLRVAAELHLARARLAHAATLSDPDLPRLWILANALTHAVPADVIRAVPARSHGPIAQLRPYHDDLVGWAGIRTAVAHLDATVQAVHTGHTWLAGATDTPTNRLLALGLLDLTHPSAATRLAVRPAAVGLDAIRGTLRGAPPPQTLADLSDPALKAVCDRNGWLHGTADERTSRELVERRTPTGPDARSRLASANPTTVPGMTTTAPTDPELDRATWRDTPPTADAVHRRQLLNAAGREALHRFADHDIHPHATRAAALAARYPDRIARRALGTPAAQLAVPGEVPPAPGPDLPAQIALDLGL